MDRPLLLDELTRINKDDRKSFTTLFVDKNTGEVTELFYFDFPVLTTKYIKMKHTKDILIFYVLSRFRTCFFSVDILKIQKEEVKTIIEGNKVNTNRDLITFSSRVMNIDEAAQIMNAGGKKLSNSDVFETLLKQFFINMLMRPNFDKTENDFKKNLLSF